jgi:RNA polymerase sigma-70 factor, ECF subfamily
MTALEFHYELINLQEALISFAYSLTSNKDDAKDLVQETFLKALNHRERFKYYSNLKAWTYTVLKNTFINNYRTNVRHKTHSVNTEEGFSLNFMSAPGSEDPSSIYASKELEKVIETLDEELKLPIKMLFEGYKYKEIAEKLDMKIGTVKSRVFYSRKRLIKQINE